MKKYLLFATALAALASCTSDDFVGETTSPTSKDVGAIGFYTKSKAITRADVGADAAAKLNNNFVVEGIKTTDDNGTSTVAEVFDNYNVNYVENTANTTASNTANWEYVNQAILTGKTAAYEQSIKYWDFAASQYDFWAYSLGRGSANVSTLAHDATLTSAAYTISGSKADLAEVYISDLVTAYNPVKSVSGVADDDTPPAVMGNEVELSFRSLLAKVRVGLYETIPGYSVRNVQFYPAEDGTATDAAVLYASDEVLPAFDDTSKEAEYTVSFPTTGAANIGNSDYNKAHVEITSDDVASSIGFGTLTYGAHQDGKHEVTTGNVWLQRSASTCTWATESRATAGDYSIVLPYETGAVLTLKLDYTLESIDGTGETIVVHGATALVPAEFTQWKANYAYTYLFKISDNTNGLTNVLNTDKVGLYPITLDAVVVDNEEGTQETITTVATPSITTYSITSDVITNDEYTTSDDIYVVATEDGSLMSMTNKATLYTITKSNAAYAATEAEVLAALTTYSTLSSDIYTGRNSVVLTPVANALDLTIEELPTVDNQTTSITPGKAALIDKSKLAASSIYAYVFNTTSGTPTTEDKYEVVTIAAGESVEGYYTRSGEGTSTSPYTYSAASGTAVDGTTYCDKYTEVTGATYAIKVIKVN